MSLFRCLLLVLAAALASSAAQAQPSPAADPIRLFSTTLLPGVTLARFLDARRADFAATDVDGDGVVSPADLARQSELLLALRRSLRLGEILRADLDGDGVVTREELERFLQLPEARTLGRIEDVLRFDSDQDGRLDWAELVAFAQAGRNAESRTPLLPMHAAIMALDEDHDGRTTWEEYRAAAERFFQSVDADHDGTLSREEIEANRQRTGAGPAAELLDRASALLGSQITCELPAAPQNARIVVIDGYRAQGLSSVAVGPPNQTTRAATVTIEPGDEPLYLVLSTSGPVVWRFDGAAGRVAKAVFMLGGDGAPLPIGVSGLPRDIVAFAPGRGCSAMVTAMLGVSPLPVAEVEARRKDSLATFKRMVGREPDLARWIEERGKLRLPSGEVESAEKPDTDDPSLSALVFKRSGKGDFTYVLSPGSRVVVGPAEAGGGSIRIESPAPNAVEEMRADFLRGYPDGVVRIDPASVVSPAPVTPYEVLPNEAGLIQLLEAGAIERNRQGEYLVKRKIRYPSGVSAKFLILKGVPMPDGDPGRSVVASEDTGELICKGPCP